MSGVIDVAVVGAGPAGLAAALAAGDLGCEVTLIDTGSGPGGQMYHQSLLFPSRYRERRAVCPRPPTGPAPRRGIPCPPAWPVSGRAGRAATWPRPRSSGPSGMTTA